MERRRFLESCAAVTGAASLGALEGAWANATPRSYPRARLVDARGTPLRARAVAAQTNYVFHYPYASTPCFLLNLGRPLTAASRCAWLSPCATLPAARRRCSIKRSCVWVAG